MLPLYDMIANAQNGQAVDLLARQFNLSQQQTQLALEALLPAFSQGLKRNAADPYGVGAFLSALSTGRHAQYFDDAANAFSSQGVAEGNGILGHLFGSKELSRAVAAQAAQATGLGQDILRQMLPVIAAMVMGGLFKQSTGQLDGGARAQSVQPNFGAAGFGGSGNPLGEIIAEMMRQGAGPASRPQPQSQAAPSPFDNPFGKILQDMFGGAMQQQPQHRPQAREDGQDQQADNPLGRIFEEMMRGAQPRKTAAPEPEPAAQRPRASPGGRPRTPYDDLFGDMFETGRQTRDEYQKNVESVFDQFLRGMDRHR
ncbi:DUF937 domain-containing protein [Nitratireductor sp. CAU 1489]|uniref:DUF937 domain-containing protein n=1 Tax=Nitratireductor arenosus TaxID=2682096 RepID=A0A844QK38_9HYPH|nr:DUF937 domain-containing protein [Nitratireductor arenosus]MVA99617.1 DUF937 domain-containing protein [Nitratireductor arenosus]